MRARCARLLAVLVALPCCSRREAPDDLPAPVLSAVPTSSGPSPVVSASPNPPDLLYLPDASVPPLETLGDGLLPLAPPKPRGRCGPDMVDVRGEFCIDRYEISLVDLQSGQALSPHYHPTRAQTAASYERYRGLNPLRANLPSVPPPEAFQLQHEFEPKATVLADVLPQGYLSGELADAACRRAGKRLCSHAEWLTACRGERSRNFPYGDKYQTGACNVFRDGHPAAILHGNASREHLDPRLGLVSSQDGPLLRRTGATASCRSDWGNDAVFDMVGNLDEWVAEGFFVGGFYSRATRDGCEARITSHPPYYFDYSLGARCCR